MPQYFTFSAEYLRDFSERVFTYFGVSAQEAATASEVLSKAEVRGIDSHGVARLRTYVDMFMRGRACRSLAVERAGIVTVLYVQSLGGNGPRGNLFYVTELSRTSMPAL